jgi:hypothetical protein
MMIWVLRSTSKRREKERELHIATIAARFPQELEPYGGESVLRNASKLRELVRFLKKDKYT